MRKALLAAGAALLLAAGPVAAENKNPIKIGFVSTFSGPVAVIGNNMRNSFELALATTTSRLRTFICRTW